MKPVYSCISIERPLASIGLSYFGSEMISRKVLQKLLQEKMQLLAVGSHDGLTGRLGQQAGFDALWASGFEISASYGVPDANILDFTAQLNASCQIRDAVT